MNFPIEIPDNRYFEKLISCREGCPVNTDARGYVQAVARGQYDLAYRIARGPNPFSTICGRVCGAPCEKACRRGTIDEPVSIRAIKRTTTERHGVESGAALDSTLAMSTAPGSVDPEPREERIAVVGAGVAGMTAAHDLARLGYAVTVFEASEAPGGMLRTGVPGFRLPNDVVQSEIDAILRFERVELQCNVAIGRDITVQGLRDQGYAAVFIGVGLQKARMLDLPGAHLDNILPGLDFLERFNTGKDIEPLGKVLVIGGGDVAYDCARSSLRLPGTNGVTMACLESLEEMPASEIEIIEGEEEGIELLNRRGPVRYVEEDGRLVGMELRKALRVFDETGRFNPELEHGTEHVVTADTVILAIGQQSDTTFAAGSADLELGRGGTVVTDRATGKTSIPWLFAGGDIAQGPGLFIDAIAQAQAAARSIHRLLSPDTAEADLARPDARGFVMEDIRDGLRGDWLNLERHFPPAADPNARITSTEAPVEHMFDDAAARLQGSRCLRCEVETVFDGNVCILCGGCADVCPTWCLRLVTLEEIGLEEHGPPGSSAIIKDEDRCIRCGLCAVRCPVDAITMERLCGYEPWEPMSDADWALVPKSAEETA